MEIASRNKSSHCSLEFCRTLLIYTDEPVGSIEVENHKHEEILIGKAS